MSARTDPHRNFRFNLEIDNQIRGIFSQATIPENSTEPIEYRTGGEPPTMRKLWSLNSFGNLSLQTGVTTDSIWLYEWRQSVEQGDMEEARKLVAVIVLDETGADAARWEFESAWPSQYDAPDLDASGNEVAIESLEIVHEGMSRVE